MATSMIEPAMRRQVVLSPREYLALTSEERAGIERVERLPARLGGADFGKFRVTFRRPVYASARGRLERSQR